MSRPKPTLTELNGADDLQKALDISNKKFVIIDLHEDWCGPTNAIIPYFNQLWIDYDEPEQRIYLATLSLESPNIGKMVTKLLKEMNSELVLAKQGCRPMFLLLRNGEAVFAVDGVNTPLISQYLSVHIPPVPKKTD